MGQHGGSERATQVQNRNLTEPQVKLDDGKKNFGSMVKIAISEEARQDELITKRKKTQKKVKKQELFKNKIKDKYSAAKNDPDKMRELISRFKVEKDAFKKDVYALLITRLAGTEQGEVTNPLIDQSDYEEAHEYTVAYNNKSMQGYRF